MTSPKYFDYPWATSGIVIAISDTTTGDGTVSYQQGWTNLYQTPLGSGGKEMSLGAWNQFCYDVTYNLQQWQNYAVPTWYSGVTYPKGASVLYTDGNIYISTAAGNTTTPPSSTWVLSGISSLTDLQANLNLYVATTGSDSNNGLSSGSPFLTIQKAINTCYKYNLNGFNITIQVADGTYAPASGTAGAYVNAPFIGQGIVTLQGNVTTPANCKITTTNIEAISVFTGGVLSVLGFQLKTITAGSSLKASQGGQINITGLMNFDASAQFQIFAADSGSKIFINSNYSVVGSATAHYATNSFGEISYGNFTPTITLTGTPAFSSFASCILLGMMNIGGATFTGSATGQRYTVVANSLINTNASGANYLPGSTAGGSATGGQYL